METEFVSIRLREAVYHPLAMNLGNRPDHNAENRKWRYHSAEVITMTILIPKIVSRLETFSEDMQQQVLDFVESLKPTAVRGTPGRNLLRFAGTINLGDLLLMQQAIEAGCEQVILNEW